MKVFLLERLISAWLSSKKMNAEFATDLHCCKLGYGLDNNEQTLEALIALDELKIKYLTTGNTDNLTDYDALRHEFYAECLVK